ncbi:MAG: methionine biosynthesis protein MetW [Opitutales bacterium]
MTPAGKRRQADFQVIARWVNEGDRVLDLGCGRGFLLEYLMRKKNVYGVGVDIDFQKALGCVKRGVPVYQGDVRAILGRFPDHAFERVVFSRTVEQLENPDATLCEGLRVGKRVTVGFVNHGYWRNRLNYLIWGSRTLNAVYTQPWYESVRSNPFSVREFEAYCAERNIRVENRIHLAGNWREPCHFLPNLRSGYAIYDLSKD